LVTAVEGDGGIDVANRHRHAGIGAPLTVRDEAGDGAVAALREQRRRQQDEDDGDRLAMLRTLMNASPRTWNRGRPPVDIGIDSDSDNSAREERRS
jgi:hypothetical protein